MPTFRILLLLAVVAGLAACAEKRPDLAPAPLLYKSDKFPYQATYDLNRWRILAPSEREIVMAQADLVLANAKADHFMSVMVERSNASLAEMRTRTLIALQQRGPDLKVVAQNPVTVAGAPALNLQIEATLRERPLAFSVVFLQYGGFAYTISYWSGTETFPDRVQDFEDFVRGFRPRAPQQRNRVEGHIAYPSPKAGYIITLPAPEWKTSREKLSPDADQQFQTDTALAYVMVIHERLPIALDSLVERGVARMRQASQGGFKAVSQETLSVDGTPARVVYGETMVQSTKFQYAILFAVNNGIAYQMAAWAPAELFQERYKAQFLDIFRAVQFL